MYFINLIRAKKMTQEKDTVKDLSDKILHCIREHFAAEKDVENIRIVPTAISALVTNLSAFMASEPEWDKDIKTEVIAKISAALLENLE
jgi:hypothetical protein